MKNYYIIAVSILLLFVILASSCDDNNNQDKSVKQVVANSVSSKQVKYNNPIDEYYLPKINSASSEATMRSLQIKYKKAWEKEFKRFTLFLKKKCVYKKDKKDIKNMEKSLRTYISSMKVVAKTKLTDSYTVNPCYDEHNENTRLSLVGNGTYSRIELIEGEMIRDACMRLKDISSEYTFTK